VAAATPAPGGRGLACRETANRVGRIQHRDYGWPGGFARLRSRRPGGELGAFTDRHSGEGDDPTCRLAPDAERERGDEYEQQDQNGKRDADDPRHPGHSGQQHHRTTSCAMWLSHGSSSALVPNRGAGRWFVHTQGVVHRTRAAGHDQDHNRDRLVQDLSQLHGYFQHGFDDYLELPTLGDDVLRIDADTELGAVQQS